MDGGEVGQLAIRCRNDCRGELELLDRIGHPAFAEALPRERGDAARAEHRPHRHLDRAGIRAGNDADAVRIGDLEHLARQIDRALEARLADLGAMRTAKRSGGELVGGPARRLGAGAGREKRPRRLHPGADNINHGDSPHRERAPRWDGVARSRQ